MPEPLRLPDGLTVETVDWLPSGARSGLVRVRGTRPAGRPVDLPELVLEVPGAPPARFTSLPDPRADGEPSAWRGAYVVEAAVAAAATVWRAEWPGGGAATLRRPHVGPAPVQEPAPEAERGGEVVDRAVLAERRARRAEAAEQAQARIAREALRAVEVLELRSAELERALASEQARSEQLQARAAAPAVPPERDEAAEAQLREEVAALRAELERAKEAAQPPPGDPVRLREALAATLTTVAELRLQLFEAQLSRRSREVAWSADAVRLVVLEREREQLREAEAQARREALTAREGRRAAEAALEQAQGAAQGAAAAHEQTRRRFIERVAELEAARERIEELERELDAVREQAAQSAEEAAAAVHAAAAEQAQARVAEAQAAARAQVAEAEAAAEARVAQEREQALEEVAVARAERDAAAERARRAEEAVADALIARELAEAAALAASAQRRAAEVAHAVAEEELRRRLEREPPAAATPLMIPPPGPVEPRPPGAVAPPDAPGAPQEPPFDLSGALGAAAGRLRSAQPRPIPVPDSVAAAAAQQQERAAAEAPEDADAVATDIDAAARALRARATIVSAPGEPPGDVVRAGRRSLPPLRGALVRLAHDDSAAAAQLIAGLLPAASRALDERVDFDVTIAGAGTFSVHPGDRVTDVVSLDRPRGRLRARFHLRADALTAAELLAGAGPRPRRIGAARTSGRVRSARSLARSAAASQLSLAGALTAGARLDPVLALRALAYAVPPAWVRELGAEGCVEVTGPRREVVYACLDGAGLQVRPEPPRGAVGARVKAGSDAVAELLDGRRPPVEGDAVLVDALGALARRAAGA